MAYSYAGEDRLVGLGRPLFINLVVGSMSARQWQHKSHALAVLAELPPMVAERVPCSKRRQVSMYKHLAALSVSHIFHHPAGQSQ